MHARVDSATWSRGLASPTSALTTTASRSARAVLSPTSCSSAPAWAQVIVDALNHNGVNGIVCLAGVSMVGALMSADVGALNRTSVLQNDVVFGTVNANRRHYEAAADALARADRSWLRRLLTRQAPLDDFASAFARRPDDVKVMLQIAS